jgi:hypothetical protein
MTNPDLGDQLARILASLEKATPQMLEVATSTVRFEAAINGLTLALLVCLCLYFMLRLWRWLKRSADIKPDERFDSWRDERRFVAWVAFIAFGIAALVMFVQLPDQVSQYKNARYYAVTTLLDHVRP